MHIDCVVFLVCLYFCIVCVSVCTLVYDNVHNKEAEKKVSKVKKNKKNKTVGDALKNGVARGAKSACAAFLRNRTEATG